MLNLLVNHQNLTAWIQEIRRTRMRNRHWHFEKQDVTWQILPAPITFAFGQRSGDASGKPRCVLQSTSTLQCHAQKMLGASYGEKAFVLINKWCHFLGGNHTYWDFLCGKRWDGMRLRSCQDRPRSTSSALIIIVINKCFGSTEKKTRAAGTARVCRFAKPPLHSDKELSTITKKERGNCDKVVRRDGKGGPCQKGFTFTVLLPCNIHLRHTGFSNNCSLATA